MKRPDAGKMVETIVPELDIRTIVLNAKDMAWLFDSMQKGVSGP